MCDQESHRIICDLSAAMHQLMLNQNEMAARAKQTNKILKQMQKVTIELKQENTRLYQENGLLQGKEGSFQKDHQPMQGMLCFEHVDNADNTSVVSTEEDCDDDIPEEEVVLQQSTCLGCQNNQPNQLAHMNPGGCLEYVVTDDEYSEDVNDEDEDEDEHEDSLNSCLDIMEFDD
tara:strand:+ start:343 stop:867 length:525 start_codon:yes stop_codon:yes gene_type:complete